MLSEAPDGVRASKGILVIDFEGTRFDDRRGEQRSGVTVEGRHVSIEYAKGALMVLFGLTATDAFEVLVQQSQHRNIKVHRLAELLVGGMMIGSDSARIEAQTALAAFLDRLGAPDALSDMKLASGRHHLSNTGSATKPRITPAPHGA